MLYFELGVRLKKVYVWQHSWKPDIYEYQEYNQKRLSLYSLSRWNLCPFYEPGPTDALPMSNTRLFVSVATSRCSWSYFDRFLRKKHVLSKEECRSWWDALRLVRRNFEILDNAGALLYWGRRSSINTAATYFCWWNQVVGFCEAYEGLRSELQYQHALTKALWASSKVATLCQSS